MKQHSTRRGFLKTLGTAGGLLALETLCPRLSLVPRQSSISEALAGGVFEASITITWWPTLPYHLPVSVAREKGWFEEAGIRIKEILGSKGGGTTVRNIVTGGLPFGETAASAAVNAYYAGEPLILFGVGVTSPGYICWVVPPDSPIETIEDLKGKTVGYTNPGSVTESLLALVLKRAGLLGQVKTKALGGVGEGLTALKQKAIEAAAIMEPILSRQKDENWRVIFRARDYVPLYIQTFWITSPDMAQQHPEVLTGFLQARARGVEFIKNNLEEAAKIFAKTADLSEEVALSSLKNITPVTYYSEGSFHQEGLNLVEEGMQAVGLIDHKIEWNKLVVQNFLPEEKRIKLS